MSLTASKWSGGFAEWVIGDTVYLSVLFTWLAYGGNPAMKVEHDSIGENVGD